MQVILYSEDEPQGLTAEWPVIPRQGDLVEYSKANGSALLKVDSVKFHANSDGTFHSVDIHLTY